MSNMPSAMARRRGFSFLELQVAFVLLGISLSGLGSLVIMQIRQVNAIEARFDDQITHYLVPTSDKWASKLGAAASIQPDPPTPNIPFSAVYVNFQPSNTLPGTFDGHEYEIDRGFVFDDRGNGYRYGWNLDNQSAAFQRGGITSPDSRYETLMLMQQYEQMKWEIAVPEGVYSVRVVSGDPLYFDSVFKVEAEGVLVVDGTPTSTDPWVEGTVSVLVTDGRLTISNAAGSFNNKLCFVHVVPGGQAYQAVVSSVDKSLTGESVAAQVSLETLP